MVQIEIIHLKYFLCFFCFFFLFKLPYFYPIEDSKYLCIIKISTTDCNNALNFSSEKKFSKKQEEKEKCCYVQKEKDKSCMY